MSSDSKVKLEMRNNNDMYRNVWNLMHKYKTKINYSNTTIVGDIL